MSRGDSASKSNPVSESNAASESSPAAESDPTSEAHIAGKSNPVSGSNPAFHLASELQLSRVVGAALRSVAGGGLSSSRKSWSHNMYPDFDDETSAVTRLARRKFAFAREVAGYDTLNEGLGQEPINAVYYKEYGDQYRCHCDGECNGGPWREGRRIATSLTYCEAAKRGGDTLFTRSGLKVLPKPGQMLFFGYKMLSKHGKPLMDTGHTEHTGCPLREGHKWIATMWFREGMSAERDWASVGDV